MIHRMFLSNIINYFNYFINALNRLPYAKFRSLGIGTLKRPCLTLLEIFKLELSSSVKLLIWWRVPEWAKVSR